MDLFYFKDIVSPSVMCFWCRFGSDRFQFSCKIKPVEFSSSSFSFCPFRMADWVLLWATTYLSICCFVLQCRNIWLLLGNYSGGIMDVFAGWLNIIIRVLYCMYLISSLGILSSPTHGHKHFRFGHSVLAFRYGQICSASDSIITVCTVCRSHAESITLHSATEITEKYSKYFTWRCCNQSFIVRVNVNAFEWFISV